MVKHPPVLSHNGRWLKRAPPNSQFYHVPEGVEVLDTNCFDASRDTLIRGFLPDTLKKINCGAFWGLTKLEHVTLPASVIYLDNDVFYDCPALKEIYIMGEPENYGPLCHNCPSVYKVMKKGRNILREAQSYEIRERGQCSLFDYDKAEA